MGKIKKWMQTMSRGLAGLMCALLVFENSGMQVLAETMPDYSSEVSEENGGIIATGTNDGETTMDGKDILASGVYYGMNWDISSEGVLTISGKYDESGDDGINWREQGYDDQITSAKVTATGVKDTTRWFAELHNLRTVDFTEFDTSQVTGMEGMFWGCSSLTSLDLSNFNTHNVTSMSYMFKACRNLVSLNISNFSTKNVTDMSHMFDECNSLRSLDVSKFDTSQVTSMSLMFKDCESLTFLDVSGFDTRQVIYMDGMFTGCSLTSLDVSNFDICQVISLADMFRECADIVYLDLSTFDMSTVEYAHCMFAGCAKLTTIETPVNLSGDVGLPCIFSDSAGTQYSSLPKNKAESVQLIRAEEVIAKGIYCGMDWVIDKDGFLAVSGKYDDSGEEGVHWNYYHKSVTGAKITATGVTSTSEWFLNFENLKNVDFSEFDTSQVTCMENMFYGCSSLTRLDLSNFDTTHVTDMGGMFDGCTGLTELELSSFKADKITYAACMFRNCSKLTILDLSGFDFENLEDYGYQNFMTGCTALETIKTPKNLMKEIALPRVFADNEGTEYTYLPINMSDSILLQKVVKDIAIGTYYGMDWKINDDGLLDISGVYDETELGQSWSEYADEVVSVRVMATGVKSTAEWFKHFSNLSKVDVSDFDTSSVTDMSSMFIGCSSLAEIDVSGFKTGNVTNMSAMFSKCGALTELHIQNFDTSKVTTMEYMFRECSALKTLDLSNFNTESLTNTRQMFWECSELKELNLSGWKTDKVANMANMFWGCNSIEQLDLSSFDMAAVAGSRGKFEIAHCAELEILKTPKNVTTEIDLPHTMYDKNGVAYTSIPEGLSESVMLVKDMTLFETPEATNDGNDKPGDTDTNDGNDKSEGDDTNDGGDEPEYTDTNDGSDKPDNTGTTDGIDADIDFTIAPIPDQTYTGKALKPEVTVTYGRDILTMGKDYTVSYKNNTKAAKADSDKAPVAIVKGKGNFEGTITIAFNILAKELTESNTEISEMFSYENGKAQTVKPTVKLNGKKMAVGKDYTIEYPDKTEGAYKNPGTYNVIIEGINNYQGSIVTTMTVLSEKQIMASKLKVGKIAACDYKENEPATPTPKVTYKKAELVLGRDYAITYLNNDRAGKATLLITGLKNMDAEGTYVAGTLKKTFTIKGTALKKAQAEYEKKVTYTGEEICPKVILTMNGEELVLGKDYSVEYVKNVNVGKATIILTGKGGFTGTVKKTFTIQADASVADKLAVSVAGGKGEISYNSKGAKPDVKVMLGYNELQIGKDYTVSYKNNKKIADANATKAPTVVIKGKGNYKFTKTVTFSIIQKFLTDADISIEAADKFVGSRKGYLSAPVVKDANGKKLKVNKDYKIISYTVNGTDFDGKDEVIAGTEVTVTVGGINNYNCWATTTYRIANSDISKTKVNKPTLVYNGDEVEFTEEMLKEGKLAITDKATDRELVYGTDFIVTGYKNNNKKGTATVTIRGIGEYGGTKNVKFSIVSKKMEKK